MFLTVDDQLHYVYIKKHRKSFSCSDPTILYKKENISYHLMLKYKWYFRYRTALFQTQYPHKYIEFCHVIKSKKQSEEKKIKRLKNLIKAAKSRITKIKNAIKNMKANYFELFPIENNTNYQKALCKLQEAENTLINYEKQYSDYVSNS